jgi:hypothetical protein
MEFAKRAAELPEKKEIQAFSDRLEAPILSL